MRGKAPEETGLTFLDFGGTKQNADGTRAVAAFNTS
jgi:hypothetical protein